jgi:hypothetical protein
MIKEACCYINEKKCARVTDRGLSTLRNDRHHGRGIPYVKIGRSVRYNLEDVIRFMEERKVQTKEFANESH